jgi:glycosyltransferase involved in cell wall biosynthesis
MRLFLNSLPMNATVRAGLLTAHLTRTGGGVFASMCQLAKSLESQPGIEIEVLGPASSAEDLSEWSPLRPRTASPIGPRFFSFAPGLPRQLRKANLDLLHLHGLWMHPSAASLAFTRQTRKPHMVSPHGMLDPWALRNSGWKKTLAAAAFENANLKSAACLHALNIAEEKAVRAHGFRGPVCVIPNGVGIPSPDRKPPAAPWWANAELEARTLLYLGRLHPKKGLPKLLTAWSRLDREILGQWRLLIAGWDEGGHQTALRRMAAALNIEGSVTFPGPLFGEDKKAAFHYCDGFILPSLSEGLPMVVLEAWAFGQPVLMTPECNLPEGFESGAALRIEPTEESLKQALTSFMAMDQADRQRIGANGRALAARRFAWPVIAAEMAAVYRWLAGNGPMPASVTAT